MIGKENADLVRGYHTDTKQRRDNVEAGRIEAPIRIAGALVTNRYLLRLRFCLKSENFSYVFKVALGKWQLG